MSPMLADFSEGWRRSLLLEYRAQFSQDADDVDELERGIGSPVFLRASRRIGLENLQLRPLPPQSRHGLPAERCMNGVVPPLLISFISCDHIQCRKSWTSRIFLGLVPAALPPFSPQHLQSVVAVSGSRINNTQQVVVKLWPPHSQFSIRRN